MEAESPTSYGYASWRTAEGGSRSRLFGGAEDAEEVKLEVSRTRLSFSMFAPEGGKTPMNNNSKVAPTKLMKMRNPFDGYLSSSEEDDHDDNDTLESPSTGSGKENDPMTVSFAPGRAPGTRQKMNKRLQKIGDYGRYSRNKKDNHHDSDSMLTSPYVSPSTYLTMDGRCVTSENPFSPMNTDGVAAKTPTMLAMPSFPMSFDLKSPEDGPPTRHRLEKRYASPPTVGKAQLPPQDVSHQSSLASMDTSLDSPDNGMVDTHKVRRLGMDGDVHYPKQQSNNNNKRTDLFVDTKPRRYYMAGSPPIDETSPTDVLSFPPPTPAKSPPNKKNAHLSTPPGTPNIRRPQRPFHANRYHQDCGGGTPDTQVTTATTTTTSRFRSDFDVIDELGKGAFGVVYKVLSRLDGCMYAMKVNLRSAKGNSERKRMLKEVYALAALSDHADPATFHIVRYHQAFIEDDRLYIQTELCTWNLANEIESANGHLPIETRWKLLREMLLALEFIHKHDMVHLDIKPQNIFVKNDTPPVNLFKLGDFGLVSKVSQDKKKEIEEGDSRYMSMELLIEDHRDLKASDIFSLGATLYEICLRRPLPTNGAEWQAIRQGQLMPMMDTPMEMDAIVRQMMHPTFSERPSASDLLRRPQLMSKEQRMLINERNKLFQAKAALAQQVRDFQKLSPPPAGTLARRNTWSGGSF
ncbi:associated tyrosine- and threonine-specific cdc2-inhibitory kinase [Seminavis robusta]|uniref:Associated tyrosine- and threonine-specific cdc2-inhibitory kinase n=1 Tax=Seminavis robusta TaxID=568900 RepID=A0A9N8HB92_9STRA|nr:associated tyrosine- and threonine-specific cdc2-inhibitory kinase [Seminavis robusta]|eukprot:Sro269_g103930.1 associated tyrosine- and threonine-specific cdc2-inhibitory kinase (691) ;mRNA; r:17508-19777